MDKHPGREQFQSEVFPSELEEITRRRARDGTEIEPLEGAPTVDHELVGLALSGGGIRSAAFSLGVIQALADLGLFRRVDYLSTVSGGGYTGACVSSLLSDPEKDADGTKFPLRLCPGSPEPPAITHLRNGSNYLSAGGVLGQLRVPNLLLRGIVLNLVAFLPAVSLMVMATEVLYETVPGWDALPRGIPALLVLFVAMSVAFPIGVRTVPRWFSWRARNAYELLLTLPLMCAVLVLISVPLLHLTRLAIEHSIGQVIAYVGSWSSRDWWHVGLAALGSIVVVGRVVRSRSLLSSALGRLAFLLLGLLGPASVFGIYLFLCLWQIDSPYLPLETAPLLTRAANCDTPCLASEDRRTSTGASHESPLVSTIRGLGRVVEAADAIPSTYSELAFALEGRGLEIGDRTAVRCLPEGCPVPAALQGKDRWGSDSRVWVLGDADEIATGCKALTRAQVLAGAADRESCHYIVRGSMDQLHIVGSGLALFDGLQDLVLLGGLLLAFGFNRLFLNVNSTSPHGFYRDRLSRVFMISEDASGGISHSDELLLSRLGRTGSAAPYHLINVALNLHGSPDEDLRGRNADFFIFSKRYSGSDRTGYLRTDELETFDPHLNLGTAMAISAAAAAPNMGSVRNRSLGFLMAMFNLRLGYWLPNPKWIAERHRLKRLRLSSASPAWVMKEALGRVTASGSRINLSDGGHLENLGIYALLRRRCKFVIAVDGEADPERRFRGLATLTRYARIDMGIEISIDVGPLRPDDRGISPRGWALGTIRYDEGELGHLLYMKLSITSREPEYVRSYRDENARFPHESTADQFFSEAQFEAYRALGEGICREMMREFEDPMDSTSLKRVMTPAARA